MTRISQRQYSQRQALLLQQSGIHPVLARIYAARGVQQAQELQHELKALLPPQNMLQLQEAAQFLAQAIGARKKLLIVADYDCDGATACAVGIRGLRMLGAQVDYIVPDRAVHGYGLTPEIVALALASKQPDIIITVDNGIASVDGVAYAAQYGVQVVVTDHHLPGQRLPDAAVIVNPNQAGCPFPSKNLAGVGVMFYVLLALRAELRAEGRFDAANQPRLDSLLDLVALGTVADVVKLDANNRILVAQGLQRMRAGRMQPGVAALFRVSGREARLAGPFDLGFALGPRVNAAGRLQDMSLGIECLITDDAERAQQLAQDLHDINLRRREIEADMQESALFHLDDFPTSQHTICVTDPEWHAGVIGIVAARLKEKFYRPVITFAPGEHGKLKGSGRSIPGFHLRDALDLVAKRAPHIIEKFGGHAMAAGLTIAAEHYEDFARAFEQVGLEWLSQATLERVVETDGALEEECYSTTFLELLEREVWGQGFAPPLFCDEFRITNQRILKEKHLKLVLEKRGRQYDAIWFGHNQSLPPQAQVAFRLDANTFNGQTKVQLLVEYAE
ncbi:single-stranded-DNA-specific exonuclease RecJ [Massilia sp. W12]|uniref:single-stranded-DNA-specific exonuclease RecJ n=1 Tax=Massilia sp. W12 TaxID=3126507 RepID=UPI0030CB6940